MLTAIDSQLAAAITLTNRKITQKVEPSRNLPLPFFELTPHPLSKFSFPRALLYSAGGDGLFYCFAAD